MSTTVINTIPYNGGALKIANKEIHSVAISATKMVKLYVQENPNLVYAHVVNVTGLEGGTPTFTNGPQAAFGANGVRVRAWKATDTRLFVMMGTEMRVLNIASDDSITITNARLTVLSANQGLWADIVSGNTFAYERPTLMSQGVMFAAHNVANNTLIMASRSTPHTNSFEVSTLFYNEQTDTFTTLGSFTTPSLGNATYSDPWMEPHFVSIPNSHNTLFYVTGIEAYVTASFARENGQVSVRQGAVLDNQGRVVRHLNMASNTPTFLANNDAQPPISAMCALDETTFIGICDGRSLRVHSGSTTQTPSYSMSTNSASGTFGSTVIFSGNGQLAMPTHAQALNSSYFIVTMTGPIAANSNTQLHLKMQPVYARIIRYVDPSFSEVVPASVKIEDNLLGVPLCPDGAPLERVGEYTLLFKSKTNASLTDTAINIRSIFGGDA